MKKSSEDENFTEPKSGNEKWVIPSSVATKVEGSKQESENKISTRKLFKTDPEHKIVDETESYNEEEERSGEDGSKVQSSAKHSKESTKQENPVPLNIGQLPVSSETTDLEICVNAQSVDREHNYVTRNTAEESTANDSVTFNPSNAEGVHDSTIQPVDASADGAGSGQIQNNVSEEVLLFQETTPTVNSTVNRTGAPEPSIYNTDISDEEVPGVSDAKAFRRLYFVKKCPLCNLEYGEAHNRNPIKEMGCGHFMCRSCGKLPEGASGCLRCKQLEKEEGCRYVGNGTSVRKNKYMQDIESAFKQKQDKAHNTKHNDGTQHPLMSLSEPVVALAFADHLISEESDIDSDDPESNINFFHLKMKKKRVDS